MIVYKYFLKTAYRYKLIILSYALIFFILSMINGASTENKDISFEESNLDIAVVDNSNSDLSNGLIDYLDKNNTIIMMEEDIAEIKEKIFLQVIEGAIIIPENFDKNVLEKNESLEVIKDDRLMTSVQIENEINKYLIFANASASEDGFNLDQVSDSLNQDIEVELIKADNPSLNTSANSWFKFYFNFTGYIIIAIYVAVLGLIMTEFKDENIEKRTKISSKKFMNFNSEIYLGQITVGAIITLIFILGSLVLKGKHIGEVDFIKYLVNTVIFSFSILCFTFLINNLTRNRFLINGLSTVASLGTAFISGVMVPQAFLSDKVLTIAKFFPTYYFVRVNETKWTSFLDIKYELFMQILFGIVFLLLGLYFSKIKQKA
ncbi:MAG: ABC transporter permease [Senegalia sp. (in: firmicutes)]|uniref:ABC transporter permease n=1 Tax=Senegalia sp. (in: firmicutes) TaxID=1924098 RepID=UPI003F9E7BDD